MAVTDIKSLTFGDNTYNLKDPTKYIKPSGGIPQTDLEQTVQNKLDKSVAISPTQPTETENKLWVDTDAGSGNSYQVPTVAESLAMGVSDAKVGDLVRVNSVDANGKPTSWKHVPLNEIKCNKNLLDNWYFVGGGSQTGDDVFPINQRGQTTYSGTVYGIDRWKQNTNNSMTVLSDGIVFTSLGNISRGFLQRIENPQKLAGKTVTLSALIVSVDGDGIIGSTISGTNTICSEPGLVKKTFVIPVNIQTLEINGNAGVNGHTIKIAAIKLELGSEQTLAHNEGTEQNPVWVLNEIPDYGEELAKCQRYFVRINPGAWNNIGFTYATNETNCSTLVALPTMMAKNPVVTFNGDLLVKNAVTSTQTTGYISGSSVSFTIQTTGLTAYAVNTFRAGPNGGYIDISAEP